MATSPLQPQVGWGGGGREGLLKTCSQGVVFLGVHTPHGACKARFFMLRHQRPYLVRLEVLLLFGPTYLGVH